MNILNEMEKWYASNCDEEWEHSFGLTIETMDNPGWSVTIDLEETNLEDKEFQRIDKHQSEESWIQCWVAENKFRGFAEPNRLEEILSIFVDWARTKNEDWLKPPAPLS